MFIREQVDAVANVAGGFMPSDDERLHPEFIKFLFQEYRAKFIPQFTNYGKNIDPCFFQDYGLKALTEVDKADSNTITWGANTKKVSIYKPIYLADNKGIQIYLADKEMPVTIVEPGVIYHKSKSKFFLTGSLAYATIINSTLYITSALDIEYINIRSILENPLQLPPLGKTVFDERTDEYPCSRELASDIRMAILQNEFNIGENAALYDETNDGAPGAAPERTAAKR